MRKITICVTLENEIYLQILMSKIKFVENSRVATGGMMSNPILLIEFNGEEENYHENGYIVKKSNNEWENDTYYTIKNPDGNYFKTFEDFLNQKEKQKIEFEYKEINN
jgi:hypothetical protein